MIEDLIDDGDLVVIRPRSGQQRRYREICAADEPGRQLRKASPR